MAVVAGPSRITLPDTTALFTHPPAFAQLSVLLDEKPEALALDHSDLRSASLSAVKFIFDHALKTEADAARHIDSFMQSLHPNEAPKTRSMTRAESAIGAAKGKGKTATSDTANTAHRTFSQTPLDALHVDGAQESQIWAQLDLRAGALCDMLSSILEEEVPDEEDEPAASKQKRAVVSSDADEDSDEEDLDMDNIDAADNSDEASDDESDEESQDETSSDLDELLSSDEEGETDTEHTEPLHDPSDDSDSESDSAPAPKTSLKKGKSVLPNAKPGSSLDDGFFSLSDFNAETEAAESRSRSSGRLNDDSDEEDSDEVDFFAPVPEEDGAATDEADLDMSTEVYYKDFFAPPSRKAYNAVQKRQTVSSSKSQSKHKGFQVDGHGADAQSPRLRKVSFNVEVRVKNIKPSPLRRRVLLLQEIMKGQARSKDLGFDGSDDEDGEMDEEDEEDEEGEEDDDEEDGEGPMNASDMMDVDWDGFGAKTDGNGLDEDDEEDDASDVEDGGRATIERLKDDLFAEDDENGASGLSAHEKRQAELAAQINELEQENVGPRDWTLMGEVGSRGRPQNALLEQDLEYDRTMRPVPSVTAERVASLEDMIKKRIIDNEFDDVVRKLAVSSLAPSARRGEFELSDQRSKQSLAQLYENDYSAAASGVDAPASEKDSKLAKEHKELEQIWETISYKLDAMCNAHFTPKQPKTKITTISDVAAASMESALPTSTSLSSMLAPEEVSARATRVQLTAKSEMSPAEKRAQRLREKKAKAKRSDTIERQRSKVSGVAKGAGAVKKEKKKALEAVTKGKGVTVVGKGSAKSRNGIKAQQGTKRTAPPVNGQKLKL